MNPHSFIFIASIVLIGFIATVLGTNSKWSYDHYTQIYFTQKRLNESYNIIIPYEQFLYDSVIAHIVGIIICSIAVKALLFSLKRYQDELADASRRRVS